MIPIDKINVVIKKAQTRLIGYQHEDGSMYGAIDFHIWANAAYLLLIDYCGIKHDKKEYLINWVIKNQNIDGSWGI